MKKLLYISILAFLLSCTKGGGNVYVEGRVYNPITGEGIEGANIILFRDKPFSGAPGAQSGGSKTVESVVTDSDGHYEIKHAGIADYTAKMYSLGNYEAIGWVNIHSKNKTYNAAGQGTFDVKLSKNMHADFQAVPYGYLKLSIHNINCTGGDKMILYQGNQIGSFDFDEPWEHDGCVDWQSNGYSKIPMGNQYYKWVVTRAGITNIFYDTVYIAEGEYKTYTIDY